VTDQVKPVDEILPTPQLFTLGLQHVLVMYAGAIAVPLIIGRVLKLEPQDVAFLISADLFVCGIVTIIQSLGMTRYFGVQMPVMMGVTFASVGPMIAIGLSNPGYDGARRIFGSIIGAGIIAMLIAPLVSKMLRFFPPVVTGTIILIIGVSLMRIGINWIFGLPLGPTAPKTVSPEHVEWLKQITDMAAATGSSLPAIPKGLGLAHSVNNPAYASLPNMAISAVVLVAILAFAKYGKGFVANIAVLLGIVVGGGGSGHDAF
jgi:xanthine/uracil permease